MGQHCPSPASSVLISLHAPYQQSHAWHLRASRQLKPVPSASQPCARAGFCAGGTIRLGGPGGEVRHGSISSPSCLNVNNSLSTRERKGRPLEQEEKMSGVVSECAEELEEHRGNRRRGLTECRFKHCSATEITGCKPIQSS